MSKRFISVFLLLSVLPLFAQEPDPLKYEVTVNVRIIPLFAIDDKGAPVFDLKKEEVELTVNGKKITLDQLLKRNFFDQPAAESKIPDMGKNIARPQERIIFVVLDLVHNSTYGISRTKRITEELILTANKSDKLVIMGIQAHQGLFQITGVEQPGPEMVKKVRQLEVWGQKNTESDMRRPDIETGDENIVRKMGIENYTTDAIREDILNYYTQALKILRYAIKLFVQPKVLYLISEGFEINSQSAFRLKEIVTAMNEAGVVLFTINPGNFVR